jgi:hypothetical protein
MSQQASIWSRFMAAALQTHEPEAAAKKADGALAEYNKRMETLAKDERTIAQLALTLEMRDEQAYIGLRALMAAGAMFEHVEANGIVNVNVNDDHWMGELRSLAKNHLRLVGNTWTIVPYGIHENDPKLRKRTP